MRRQMVKQPKLQGAEFDLFARNTDRMSRRIDDQVAALNGIPLGYGFVPPQQSTDASHEFAHAEWLCDVVICAEFQANHTICFPASSGQHEYRDSRVPVMPSHLPADFQTIHAGKHEIEHQQVWFFSPKFCHHQTAVSYRTHPKTFFFEVIFDEPYEIVFVFNDENFFSHVGSRRPQSVKTKP